MCDHAQETGHIVESYPTIYFTRTITAESDIELSKFIAVASTIADVHLPNRFHPRASLIDFKK